MQISWCQIFSSSSKNSSEFKKKTKIKNKFKNSNVSSTPRDNFFCLIHQVKGRTHPVSISRCCLFGSVVLLFSRPKKDKNQQEDYLTIWRTSIRFFFFFFFLDDCRWTLVKSFDPRSLFSFSLLTLSIQISRVCLT